MVCSPIPDFGSDDHGFRVGYAGVRVWVSLHQPSAYPYPHGRLSNPLDTRRVGEYFAIKNLKVIYYINNKCMYCKFPGNIKYMFLLLDFLSIGLIFQFVDNPIFLRRDLYNIQYGIAGRKTAEFM